MFGSLHGAPAGEGGGVMSVPLLGVGISVEVVDRLKPDGTGPGWSAGHALASTEHTARIRAWASGFS